MNLQEMAEKYGPKVYVLSGWAPDEEFQVKLRRPTIYNMAAMGYIPNPIMGAVQTMFSGNSQKIDAIDARKQGEAVVAMAKFAMLEPTYQEVIDAGLMLTDDQLIEIYTFALGGAPALAAFRGLNGGRAGNAGVDVSDKAERGDAD